MSTQGIRAGRAFVEIFADDSKLVRGLKRAQARLAAFGSGVRAAGVKMLGIGSMLAAPLAMAARTFDKMGSEMLDMSKRTGVSVEALSELGYAADQSGASLSDLETSLRKMQRTIVDSTMGTITAQEAMSLLGLTVENLVGLSPENQFKLIAERLDKISDPTTKAAAAMEVFGKSGTSLLPMMEGGIAGLDAYAKAARRLGLVMSTQDAVAADQFGDVLSDLGKVLKMSVFTIGAALAPALQKAALWITDLIVRVKNWIGQNRGLVESALKITAGIMGAGVAMIVMGTAITGLAKGLGVLSMVFPVIKAAITAIIVVLAGILSPIGLIVTAIVGLGGYFLYASGAAGKAMDWLSGVINSVATDAVDSFGAISNALAGGDIVAAAKVLWTQLKYWWQAGTGWISDIWNNCLLWLKQRFFESVGGWRIIFSAIGHGLTVAWIETTSFLSQTWTNFVTGLQKAWNWCGNMLQKAWNKIKGVFDSSFDSDTANKAAEEVYQAKQKELDDNKDFQLAERERQRQAERDVESKDFDDQLNRIIDETEAAKDAAARDRDAKSVKNQADIDAARKELEDARKQARAVQPHKGVGDLSMDEYMKKVAVGIGPEAKTKSSVAGTFNAAALQGLAANGPAEKIAKNTEATAKNTAKLLEKDFGDNMAFA